MKKEETMPTYREFLFYVKENILQYMPPSYRDHKVKLIQNVKDNDQKMEGITIQEGKKTVEMCPAVYLETYYIQFLSGRDIDHVMHGIAAEYLQAVRFQERLPLPNLLDFGVAKSRIQYRILNQRMNRDRLRDAVYQLVEDLAKVYMITGQRVHGFEYAAVIRKDILQEWGITEHELEQVAERNMKRNFHPVLVAGSEERQELTPQQRHQKNLLTREKDICREMLFILTNEERSLGATAILLPDMAEQIHKRIGDDYYILPVSLDEVLIAPKRFSTTPKKLGMMLREANQSIPREVILSDCVYEFTRENPQIRRVPESMLQKEKSGRDER